MIKKSLRVMVVFIVTALLAISLTACQGGDEGDNRSGKSREGDLKTNSGSVDGQDPITEWEVLTSEVMKLYRSGDYIQGVKVANRALQVAQQNDGPNHPNVALSLSNLAELYEIQKEYAKAEQLYKRSLEILGKAFGQDDPYLVPTLLNMESLYNNTGRKNEAQKMMERANKIQTK